MIRFLRRPGSRFCILLLALLGFLDAMDVSVRNFPSEIAALAMLFDVLFEENGAAGIRGKHPRSGQEYVSNAVLHRDAAPKKMRVGSHPKNSVSAGQPGQ